MRDLENLRDEQGRLPAVAWPGGDPIVYFDEHGEHYCPSCANKKNSNPVGWFVHWEGYPTCCADCNAMIESAYGYEGMEEDVEDRQ